MRGRIARKRSPIIPNSIALAGIREPKKHLDNLAPVPVESKVLRIAPAQFKLMLPNRSSPGAIQDREVIFHVLFMTCKLKTTSLKSERISPKTFRIHRTANVDSSFAFRSSSWFSSVFWGRHRSLKIFGHDRALRDLNALCVFFNSNAIGILVDLEHRQSLNAGYRVDVGWICYLSKECEQFIASMERLGSRVWRNLVAAIGATTSY